MLGRELMSQVICFTASSHFIEWLEAQQLEGESVSQTCQRVLMEARIIRETNSTREGVRLSAKAEASLSRIEHLLTSFEALSLSVQS